MTARDILHGRQGGTVLPWEAITGPPLIVVVCDDGMLPALHRWREPASRVGKPCFTCRAPLRRPNHLDEAIVRYEAARQDGNAE
ncbi:MAG TPA: hypothetical protein VFJ85_02915 [Acidimicrobiales bacterium]|nr:hypothetical protein [Acidimicrobiales bacterium]